MRYSLEIHIPISSLFRIWSFGVCRTCSPSTRCLTSSAKPREWEVGLQCCIKRSQFAHPQSDIAYKIQFINKMIQRGYDVKAYYEKYGMPYESNVLPSRSWGCAAVFSQNFRDWKSDSLSRFHQWPATDGFRQRTFGIHYQKEKGVQATKQPLRFEPGIV